LSAVPRDDGPARAQACCRCTRSLDVYTCHHFFPFSRPVWHGTTRLVFDGWSRPHPDSFSSDRKGCRGFSHPADPGTSLCGPWSPVLLFPTRTCAAFDNLFSPKGDRCSDRPVPKRNATRTLWQGEPARSEMMRIATRIPHRALLLAVPPEQLREDPQQPQPADKRHWRLSFEEHDCSCRRFVGLQPDLYDHVATVATWRFAHIRQMTDLGRCRKAVILPEPTSIGCCRSRPHHAGGGPVAVPSVSGEALGLHVGPQRAPSGTGGTRAP
jgi:hypothetical protein